MTEPEGLAQPCHSPLFCHLSVKLVATSIVINRQQQGKIWSPKNYGESYKDV